MEHWLIYCSGEVQGVGYRAYAKKHADTLGIRGYAENLTDGRVRVEAISTQHDLAVFCEMLSNYPNESTQLEITLLDEVMSIDGFDIC
jgi:acylphosphatase